MTHASIAAPRPSLHASPPAGARSRPLTAGVFPRVAARVVARFVLRFAAGHAVWCGLVVSLLSAGCATGGPDPRVGAPDAPARPVAVSVAGIESTMPPSSATSPDTAAPRTTPVTDASSDGPAATADPRPIETPAKPDAAPRAPSLPQARHDLPASGIATVYHARFHGRRTSSGARYDHHGLSAAHRTLPIGSTVRVTSLASGRSVDVTINDRGPWIKGRLIDLSSAAAKRLGMHRPGTMQVRIEASSAASGTARTAH